MYSKQSLLIGTHIAWCTLTGASVLFARGRIWRGHRIMETQVKRSTTHVSVGQRLLNHGIHGITYLCSRWFKNHELSPFWYVSSHLFSTTCCLGKPNSAVRDVEMHVGIHNSSEGMRPLGQQPSQARPNGPIECHQSIIWQRRKWEIRPIKMYFFRYFDDNHYIIHTHYKCTLMCWLAASKRSLSLVFDSSTNQQIVEHLWGPIVMGPYNNVVI